ncbi:MAG: hypothetical protein H5T50_04615 [Nitrososphaeria archaeon]|nr:hypothetical protein [Nitrososphaeria archaeon]
MITKSICISMQKAQAKNIAKVAKEYNELYSTINSAKDSIDCKEVNKHVNKITKKGKSNFGNKITSLGIALIAFPDPTISDIIGSALVLSGQYIQRRSPIGIEDVYKEFNNIGLELKRQQNNLR